jgi:hypothetical protein
MGEYVFLNTLIVSVVVAKWLSREPFNIKIWDLYSLSVRVAEYIKINIKVHRS